MRKWLFAKMSMSLYKHFAVKDKVKLPHPTGRLSLSLSSSAIVTANGEVAKVMDSSARMDSERDKSKQGEYSKFSPKVKIELAKRAAQKNTDEGLLLHNKYYHLIAKTVSTSMKVFSVRVQQLHCPF